MDDPNGVNSGGDKANGDLSTGGIGGIVGGLLGILAALLLFILLRERTKKPEECEAWVQETDESISLIEGDNHINDYGLSDGRPIEDVEDPGDEVLSL